MPSMTHRSEFNSSLSENPRHRMNNLARKSDMGSIKEGVDLINGLQPHDAVFADITWAKNAITIISRYPQAQKDGKLMVRQLLCIDGILQHHLRIRGITRVQEMLVQFDTILVALDKVEVKRPFWSSFKFYLQGIFFARVAAAIALRIKKNALGESYLKYVCVSLMKAQHLLQLAIGDSKASSAYFYVSAAMECLQADVELQIIRRYDDSDVLSNAVQCASNNSVTPRELSVVSMGGSTITPFFTHLVTPILPADRTTFVPIDAGLKEQCWSAIFKHEQLVSREDFLERMIWVLKSDLSLANAPSVFTRLAFPGLQYSTPDLKVRGIETLNILDVLVFIELCTKFASLRSNKQEESINMRLLEQSSTNEAQRMLWNAVYGITHDNHDQKLRPSLLKLVEVVRLSDTAEMFDLRLIFSAANYLQDQFTNNQMAEEKKAAREYARLYWQKLHDIIDRPPLPRPQSIFYLGSVPLTNQDRHSMTNTIMFNLGIIAIDDDRKEEAKRFLMQSNTTEGRRIVTEILGDVPEGDETIDHSAFMNQSNQEVQESQSGALNQSFNRLNRSLAQVDRLAMCPAVNSVSRANYIQTPPSMRPARRSTMDLSTIAQYVTRSEQSRDELLQTIVDSNREVTREVAQVAQKQTVALVQTVQQQSAVFGEQMMAMVQPMMQQCQVAQRQTTALVEGMQLQTQVLQNLSQELIAESREARAERRQLIGMLSEGMQNTRISDSRSQSQPAGPVPTMPVNRPVMYQQPMAYATQMPTHPQQGYAGDVADMYRQAQAYSAGTYWPGQNQGQQQQAMEQARLMAEQYRQQQAQVPAMGEAAALRNQVMNDPGRQQLTVEEVGLMTNQILRQSGGDPNMSSVLAGLAQNVRIQENNKTPATQTQQKAATPVPIVNIATQPTAIVSRESVAPPTVQPLAASNIRQSITPVRTTVPTANTTTVPSFGGFSFTTPPVVKHIPKENKPVESKDKPKEKSLFHAFGGFGNAPNISVTPIADGAPNPLFKFDNSAATTPTNNIFGAKAAETGAQNNAKSPQKGPLTPDGADDHFEPQVDFAPVVPLPDLVEVTTGEENEEILFCERSKLFRFVEGEFKERGLGEIKILKDKINGKRRIILRREQVHKLAANHVISSLMKISPMENTDKAFVWKANDFAEEELKEETFAAKFKTAEIAQKFCECFEASVKAMENYKSPEKKESKPAKVEEKVEKPVAAGFGDKFKVKAGSWECQGCMIRNESSVQDCPCCGTSKTGDAPKAGGGLAAAAKFDPQPIKALTQSAFVFGIKPSGDTKENTNSGGIFGAKPAENKDTPLFDQSAGSSPKFGLNKHAGASIFGQAAATNSPSIFGQKPANTPTIFGQTSSKDSPSIFGQSVAKDTATIFGQTAGKDSPSIFGQPLKTSIFGQAAPASPAGLSFAGLASNKSTDAPNQKEWFANVKSADDKKEIKPMFSTSETDNSVPFDANDSGALDENYEPSVEFEPVVPLPDLIDVQTGEEDEYETFCERSKLFRWVKGESEGEFKERGLGELKILRHKITGKHRLLLRREQVHKLAANHIISPDIKLTAMNNNEKAYVWTANDFTEGQLQMETFAARFKTVEIAKNFAEKFEEAKEGKVICTPDKNEKKLEKEVAEPVDVSNSPLLSTPTRKSDIQPAEINAVTPDTFSFKACTPTVSTVSNNSSPFGGGLNTQSPSSFGAMAQGSIFGGAFSATGTGSIFGASKGNESGFGNGASDFSFKLPSSASEKSSGTDLDILYDAAENVSKEDVDKAKAMQLPVAFFAPNNKTCEGCIGCLNDEDVDKLLQKLGKVGSEDFDGDQTHTPNYDNDDDEDDDEIDELWHGKAILDTKTCNGAPKTHGVVEVCIVFDNDVDGYRIIASDQQNLNKEFVNHVIVQEYKLDCGLENEPWVVKWNAKDYGDGSKAVEKNVTLTFDTMQNAIGFKDCFQEGIDVAKNNNISLETPEESFVTAGGSGIDPRVMEAMKNVMPFDPESRNLHDDAGFGED